MSDEIVFLPYLRRGLSQLLENPDPLTGDLPREPELTATVAVEDRTVLRSVILRGAGEATALGPGQVLRSEPRPDSVDVEPNYFPLVELKAADLPWLLTPAAPNAREERLRPWLVLVCVEEEAATFAAGSDGRPARLVAPTTFTPQTPARIINTRGGDKVGALDGFRRIERVAVAEPQLPRLLERCRLAGGDGDALRQPLEPHGTGNGRADEADADQRQFFKHQSRAPGAPNAFNTSTSRRIASSGPMEMRKPFSMP